jgi:hypothetical protein
MGLTNSKHIGRIVIDPENNDIVLAAAAGSLWGPGGERGVYKTTDGGKTWKNVLKGDDNTGANDLVMTSDRRVLYATLYQRQRSQCCMNGAGPGSGIYKSTDGGDNWTKLTNGLPTANLGRIAIDAYRASGNIVYAEVQAEGARRWRWPRCRRWRRGRAGYRRGGRSRCRRRWCGRRGRGGGGGGGGRAGRAGGWWRRSCRRRRWWCGGRESSCAGNDA